MRVLRNSTAAFPASSRARLIPPIPYFLRSYGTVQTRLDRGIK